MAENRGGTQGRQLSGDSLSGGGLKANALRLGDVTIMAYHPCFQP